MDLSGCGNHGTLIDMDPATDWVPSALGMVLDFDGSDDYINLGTNLKLGTLDFTISAWVNPLVSTQQHICGTFEDWDNRWYLSVRRESYIHFYARVSGTIIVRALATIFEPAGWMHIVLTARRGQYTKIYLNGMELALGVEVYGTGTIDNTAPLHIAEYAGNHFEGRMANGVIPKRALSPGDVRELYEDPWCMLRPDRRIIVPFSSTVGHRYREDSYPNDAYSISVSDRGDEQRAVLLFTYDSRDEVGRATEARVYASATPGGEIDWGAPMGTLSIPYAEEPVEREWTSDVIGTGEWKFAIRMGTDTWPDGFETHNTDEHLVTIAAPPLTPADLDGAVV